MDLFFLFKLSLLLGILATPTLGLPQRSEWYNAYNQDYSSPLDPAPYHDPYQQNGEAGGQWQEAYEPVVANPRQDTSSSSLIPEAGEGVFKALRAGLKDIGKHVVGGFSKLTGLELPEVRSQDGDIDPGFTAYGNDVSADYRDPYYEQQATTKPPVSQ